MIKEATIDDFRTVEKMAREFYAEAEYAKHYGAEIDDDSLINFLVMFIGDDDKVILFDENKGMISGALVPWFFNNSHLMAQEMCWYVSPEYRKTLTCARLIKAFENWAREKGASVLMMASITHLNGDRINKFYERNNMHSLEQFYGKVLECRQ